MPFIDSLIFSDEKKRKTIKDVVYFINKKDKERNEKQEEEEAEEKVQIEELFRVERSLRSTSGWITRLFLLDDKKKTKKKTNRWYKMKKIIIYTYKKNTILCP